MFVGTFITGKAGVSWQGSGVQSRWREGRGGLPGGPGESGLQAAAGELGANEALQLRVGAAGAPEMTAEPRGEAKSTSSKGLVPQDSPF